MRVSSGAGLAQGGAADEIRGVGVDEAGGVIRIMITRRPAGSGRSSDTIWRAAATKALPLASVAGRESQGIGCSKVQPPGQVVTLG